MHISYSSNVKIGLDYTNYLARIFEYTDMNRIKRITRLPLYPSSALG